MATAREVILAVMHEVQGVAKRDRNSCLLYTSDAADE